MALAVPPPLMARLGRTAVERLGKTQLWRIPRALRRCAPPLTADAARACLRGLDIFLSDEDFALVADAYGRASFDVDAFMRDFVAGTLNARRRYVVDLVMQKLDPEQTGLISTNKLSNEYDSLRHPDVTAGLRSTDDVAAEFFGSLQEDGAPGEASDGTALTREELQTYYCGLSLATAADEAFELRCIRSFSLDRPRTDFDDETARMEGSRAVSRQSRMLGQGKAHPLYTTTSGDYGSAAAGAPPTASKYGRSQQFTRSQPPRLGGATSMNM